MTVSTVLNAGVGTYAADSQPLVATSKTGQTSVVAWTGKSAAGVEDVYFELFNASGTPTTGAINVTNNTSANGSVLIGVSMNNTGQFVVYWDTGEAGSGGINLIGVVNKYQRFSSTTGSAIDLPVFADPGRGEPNAQGVGQASPGTPINVSGSGGPFGPPVFGPGGFGSSGPAGPTNSGGSSTSASSGSTSGGGVGGPYMYTDPSEDHQAFSVAIDDANNIVVMSTDTLFYYPYNVNLYVHQFDAQDNLSNQFLVTSSGTGASLAIDPQSGQFAISWVDAMDPFLIPTVHLQAYTRAGAYSDSYQVTASSQQAGGASFSSVAINNSGQIVVAWLNTVSGGAKSIQEQNFTFNGSATGTAIATSLMPSGPISTVATASSNSTLGYTSVSLNDSGNYVVGFDYQGVAYLPSGTFGVTAPSQTLNSTQSGSAIFRGYNDQFQPTINFDHWTALNNSGGAIYAYLIIDPTTGLQQVKVTVA